MSIFKRLTNLARGKVIELQKSFDEFEADPEELVGRAREAARKANEQLARAAGFDAEPERSEPQAEAPPAPEASPPAPENPAPAPPTPKKRRL
ncbi:MAG: hypothetical protein AAGA48_12385 [Myxococcota bacterium]